MKRLTLTIVSFTILVTIVASCQQASVGSSQLQVRIDSLQNKLDSVYVPGTGEIMNGIVQPHHYKLWLAAQHQNWALAEYERHQLLGGFKRILKFHKNTHEANAIPMIYPALEGIQRAIKKKDAAAFNSQFVLLTKACNTCHLATKYAFNVITVPAGPDFGNQHF